MKKTNIFKALAICSAVIMTFTACGAGDQSTSGNSKNDIAINNNSQQYKYSLNQNDEEAETGTEMGDVQQENPNTEEYSKITENQFLSVKENPRSTFSTDVDTASYTNVRRMINDGEEINSDAVRTEEFINYFKYNYEQPKNDDAISITTELSDCPWNDEAKLMLVGLQAKEAETKDIDSNIVFLIDVSGSMSSEDKLPLVQQAFSMLAENLTENDRVSIVTYAGSDQVVLKGESGDNAGKITDALNSLSAGGSTAGAAGINTAYELAEKYFIKGGNNRVILATDGDLNVGVSSEEGLKELIEEKRDSGIFLSVLGFGTGNLKDNKLETLADNGNGNYSYIDSLDEAKRVLVTEMNGTLYTIAKDTKIQIEFNPQNVDSYRLVGYENRLLDDEDFEDDTKDAGDIGSGQQVTALYEIIPTTSSGFKKSENLKYQQESDTEDIKETDGELLTVSVRYKAPDGEKSKLIDKAVKSSEYQSSNNMPENLKFASSAAEFAMLLRNSENVKGKITADDIIDQAKTDNEGSSELIDLIKKYISMD